MHTFSYKKKIYRVENLIQFTKIINKNTSFIDISTLELDHINVIDIWSDLKIQNNKQIKLPFTFEQLSQHIKRIENSSINYPIIVLQTRNKYKILDGWHRTLKANIENIKHIKAYVLNYNDMNEFIKLYQEVK